MFHREFCRTSWAHRQRKYNRNELSSTMAIGISRNKAVFMNILFFVAGSCCTAWLVWEMDLQKERPPTFSYTRIVKTGRATIDKDIAVQMDKDILRMINEDPCACLGKAVNDKYTTEVSNLREEERKDSLTRYNRRQICTKDIYNHVNGNSPISYPASGLYVRPLRAVLIKGLRIEWFHFKEDFTKEDQKVQFYADKGVFTLLAGHDKVRVNGKGTKHMTIKATSVSLLNLQLRHVVYQNTEFDTNIFDKVCLRYMEFNAIIPIHIQHRQVPWLYRKGTLQERVTVVVKTFLRYHKVRYLINSINQFYPGTTIILVDDTPNNTRVTFPDANIIHHRMPAFAGYFAGRNLGLSQVTTEYFLYMDDDQYFTSRTKLEVFVSLLDKTNFHLVSGTLPGRKYQVYSLRVLGNDTHSCFMKTSGNYQEIVNFPGCYATDHTANFFLASTNEVKAVGFDPHPALSRIGHYAFFLSALGKLRIAVCTSVEFGHNNSRSKEDADYAIFRYQRQDYNRMKTQHELFKYNFACNTPNGGKGWHVN